MESANPVVNPALPPRGAALDFYASRTDMRAGQFSFRNSNTGPMNDQTKPHSEAADIMRAEATATSAEGAAPDCAAQAGEIEALQAEVASLKDRLLRTMADMENLRRRTDREVADSRTYGATNFARDMLGVVDNLHRGIESLSDDLKNSDDPALKSFIEGVKLTEADFLSRLTRHGVKKLEPLGQKFDPNKEEALFEVPDESVPAGTVVQVVEGGYTIGDRVLRPAKVGVSRGGPKG